MRRAGARRTACRRSGAWRGSCHLGFIVTDRCERERRIPPKIGPGVRDAGRGLRAPAFGLTGLESASPRRRAIGLGPRRARALPDLLAAWALVSGLLFLAAALLAAPAAPPAEATRVFVADPAASRVRVKLGRAGIFGFLGHDHLIEAPIAEGRIELGADAVRGSRVAFRFRAAALAVVPGTEPAGDIPEVEARMRGPEVLDADRYPEIAFDSTEVHGRGAAAGALDLRVRGWLTLRGRRHVVEVPVRVRIDGESLSASGQVELRLRDLGIEPPSVAGVVNVANRFTISIDVRAASAPVSPSSPGDGRSGTGRGTSAAAAPGRAEGAGSRAAAGLSVPCPGRGSPSTVHQGPGGGQPDPTRFAPALP
jgi:polyisoprenoid-binding protein YceI